MKFLVLDLLGIYKAMVSPFLPPACPELGQEFAFGDRHAGLHVGRSGWNLISLTSYSPRSIVTRTPCTSASESA